jgi:inositol transporter-like SP family MFS transporter
MDTQGWRRSLLVGFANYIDGGSIIAGSATLPLWAEQFHLEPRFLGLIAAFSANGIAAGVGALFGGFLCDRVGRKTIYQYDMLFYAFGMAWLVFAVTPAMVIAGSVLVGLAVGADIPASWSLIAEGAPERRRGAHSAVAQVLWVLGPLVVLLMFFVLAPYGITGARVAFAHLMMLALVLAVLRSRIKESQIWLAARGLQAAHGSKRKFWTTRNVRAMTFLIGLYGIWNLYAGTLGFFLPFLLRTFAGQTQAAAVGFQALGATLSMLFLILVFMRYVDRVNQRILLGISIVLQLVGITLFAVLPPTRAVVFAFILISSVSSLGSIQAFYQLWSTELFPTLIRGTAQGITFAVVRVAVGVWSLFVPLIAAASFTSLVWILDGFLIASGLIGLIWAPRNEGKSLQQIEIEIQETSEGASRRLSCGEATR